MACTFAAPCPTVNATGFAELFTYANTVTGDVFGFFVLMMVFMIAFTTMHLRGTPMNHGLPAAMFLVMIVAFLEGVLGLVDQSVVLLAIIGTVGSAILLNLPRNHE